MSVPFSINIRSHLLERLPEISNGNDLVSRLAHVMDEQNQLTVAHIQQDYLSFPKDEPPTMEGLRVQDNRLRPSIRASKTQTAGGQLESGIGSNVVYAAIQEFGGQTRAHDIVARNAEALAFIPGGGKVFSKAALLASLKGKRGNIRKAAKSDYFSAQGIIFRKRVHHPGSDIPARQYAQRGLEDRMAAYAAAFNQTVEATLLANLLTGKSQAVY